MEITTLQFFAGGQVIDFDETTTDVNRPGILFRNQHYNEATRAANSGGAPFGTYSEQLVRVQAIAPLTGKSYRKYSWLQQPDSATWGSSKNNSCTTNGS